MIFFKNDYGEGCIQPILDLLQEANEESSPGYGHDRFCSHAAELIKSKMVDSSPDIHFIVSGTLTNAAVLRHILRSYEGVICCDSGHIALHEVGAIEATGHKVITVPNNNGKLTSAQIRRVFHSHMIQYEHMVYPKAVYISNATELGTVYSRQELEDISKACRDLGLYLFMDGARLGAALMSGVDYTLNDLTRWCDVFYIGGTKNGALFGEAVVITNEALKPSFRFVMKQSGAVMAKGWLLGLQFIGLFENDDFYKCARHANDMAAQIQEAIMELGYPRYVTGTTNQLFIIVTPAQYDYLKSRVEFEVWDTWNDQIIIRLVTSWHTTADEVEYLIVYLKEAAQLISEEEEEEEMVQEADS